MNLNSESSAGQKPEDTLPLLTSRLVLRRFSEADINAFSAYRNDPEVALYQCWETCTPIQASDFIRTQISKTWGILGQWIQIAITLRETGLLIGDCGLKLHQSRQATIGITLSRSHQGHGFGFEALSALFDLLFCQFELHRVIADTDSQNKPAWTLLERLGMRREGHFKQSLWFKGNWADEYHYALLRHEWLHNPNLHLKSSQHSGV